MRGPEAKIEDRVCDYAKKSGCATYKFVSPNRRSVPDRIFFHQGHCWFIEFKAPGKKPTSGQKREIERLRVAGIETFIVDGETMGRMVIDAEIKKGRNGCAPSKH